MPETRHKSACDKMQLGSETRKPVPPEKYIIVLLAWCVCRVRKGPFLPQGWAPRKLIYSPPLSITHTQNLHARRYTGAFVVNFGAFAEPGSKPAGEYAKIERAPPTRTRDDEIKLLKATLLLAGCGTLIDAWKNELPRTFNMQIEFYW